MKIDCPGGGLLHPHLVEVKDGEAWCVRCNTPEYTVINPDRGCIDSYNCWDKIVDRKPLWIEPRRANGAPRDYESVRLR